MSSKLLCITIVLVLSYGMARTCNYRFIGLNDNITLSSSTEMYEMVHEVSLHDHRDIPAQGKVFSLNESSHYFFLEGDYLLVIACLPAGLHEELKFIIEREETCPPGYLVIDVTPTVPVFNHIPSKVTVDVDTCSTEDIIKVFDLSFENKEDCTVFNCTVECSNCHGRKRFWTKNETVIVASTKNIRIHHLYHLRVVCFDGSSTANQFDISAAVAELIVEFERLNPVPCSVPAVTSSITEISISTKTTPARTQRSTTVLTTERLPDRSSITTTGALMSLSTANAPLNTLTTTMQNANQLKQIATGPPRPLTATMTTEISSPHTTEGSSLSKTTITEKQGMTKNLQTSADPSKLLLTTVRNDLFPPKTNALPATKVTTMHKTETGVITTTKPSDSISTTMQNTESILRTTKTTTVKKADTAPQTTTQSSKYMTTTDYKTIKDLLTRKNHLTSKSTTLINATSQQTKQTSKLTTNRSVWSTTSVSTTLSSVFSNFISSTAPIVSGIATTPPTSTFSTSTSGSSTPINNANDGFFNKTENIAAVSAAGGVVLLCAMISIIYAAWSKCCQESISSSGGGRKNGNRVLNTI